MVSELISKIKRDIKKYYVVAQIAPACRVAIGESFGVYGKNLEGEMITALKKLGIKEVFDTPLGADYVSKEELKKINVKGTFSSCCPAWRLYAKKHNMKISKTLSPNLYLAKKIKEVISKERNIAYEKIKVLSIMPCILKKLETSFKEDNFRLVDYVLTTVEFATWLKQEKIDLLDLKKSNFSQLLPKSTSSGVQYAISGGIINHILSDLGSEKRLSAENEIEEITYKKYKFIKINNLNKTKIIFPKNYNFIEVMACKYGCINGSGQPKATKEVILKRINALRSIKR